MQSLQITYKYQLLQVATAYMFVHVSAYLFIQCVDVLLVLVHLFVGLAKIWVCILSHVTLPVMTYEYLIRLFILEFDITCIPCL